MLRGLLIAIAAVGGVRGGVGPQALYNLLNGQTFNPPGYTIVMYQSCMQNQNAGNPCGSFSTFETSNGVYTRQRYGPEAPVSTTCSRTFLLSLACGATMSMSGVNENPTCVYSATLTLPQACGIDMTVGNEAASVSGTVAPATPSITRSGSVTYTGTQSQTGTPSHTYTGTQSQTGTQSHTYTATGTQSQSGTPSYTYTSSTTLTQTGTPTNIYEFTLIPSKTVSPSVAATTTPLFMVTGWPTPSPVNVSATSSPLFMVTAYPTNTTGAVVAAATDSTAPMSPTATILGAVAVGAIAIAGLAYAIHYFRSGGTVSGLVNKIKENKETLTKVANILPISDADKAKMQAVINDPGSVTQVVEQYTDRAIASLPISESQKTQLTSVVNSVKAKVVQRVESAFEQKPEEEINAPIQITASHLDTKQPIVEVRHTLIVEKTPDV